MPVSDEHAFNSSSELSQQVNSLRVKEEREMDLGKNVFALLIPFHSDGGTGVPVKPWISRRHCF